MGILRFLVTSWRRRVLLLVLTIALLAWLYDPLYSAYTGLRDGSIRALGVGLVHTGAWLGLIAWIVLKRHRLLARRWNVWVGSLVLLAGILGFLAFWQSNQGVLQEVTLGGDIGYAIRGTNRALGILRLVLLFFAGAWIISPRLTKQTIVRPWRALIGTRRAVPYLRRAFTYAKSATITAYTYMAIGLRGLFTGLGRVYRIVPFHRLPRWTVKGIASMVTGRRKTKEMEQPRKEARTPLDELLEGEPSEPQQSFAQPTIATVLPARPQTVSPVGTEEEEEGTEYLPVPPTATGPTETWRFPPISMLWQASEESISEEEQQKTASIIERTLAEHGIEVTVTQIKPGPTVTMYGLTPGWNRRYRQVTEKDEEGQPRLGENGRPVVSRIEDKIRVKVGSIVARENDLALALAASSIRIEAPVPGESVVGIEVPNPNPSLVTLRSVMESKAFDDLKAKAKLGIALGKASGGEVVVADLARMPHLLIAGATGSGKSVCISSIICCLIMENSPSDLRFLLIDPKRVELNSYNGIPHLLRPAVVEADQAASLLKGLINEMLRRYRSFEELGVRNIEVYNQKAAERIPHIVVCIDELADLMMTAQYEVEHSLCRLAQLGRATGIHLVIATQRPSVNVVTGLIKANFPSRISFAVVSQVDARTVLDSAGAEKLLGRGDMLYMPVDAVKPKRIQGVFISDEEIESLVRYWTIIQGPPVPPMSLEYEDGASKDTAQETGGDELLDRAIELANSYSKLSTSLLQRRLRIGYPRAARLMEELEERGIVNSGEPGKSRDVLTR